MNGDSRNRTAILRMMNDGPAATLNGVATSVGRRTQGRVCSIEFRDEISRAKSGEHRACACLYDRFAPAVLSFCRSTLSGCSIDEAEDACQESFIRAFGKLDAVEPPDAFPSFLFSIARFVCLERQRSTHRRMHHEMIAVRRNLHERPASTDATADTTLRTERMELLTRAIQSLPERERLAIHLHYLDADPLSAAKNVLKISRSGYYKLLNRAKGMLRVALQTTSKEA